MWIKKIVQDLINKYQTNDFAVITKQMNVQILEHDLHDEIYGFYCHIRKNRFIFINSNLPERKKKFVCVHELGHIILHPDINTLFMRNNTYFSIDKIEHQANLFAIEFLISDELAKKYITDNLTIYQIAALHDIPVNLVELKFKRLF